MPASPVAPVAPVGPCVIVRCKARLTPRCRTWRWRSTHVNFAQVAGQCTDVDVAAPATPAVPRAMPSTTANTVRLIFMFPPKQSTNKERKELATFAQGDLGRPWSLHRPVGGFCAQRAPDLADSDLRRGP